ncbi:MAG: helix-turn-helix transcriptional regulator [Thomasclavelia sp.]|nr:helix-turn-helix transcriptional regulator [Thomasclavelia sp.]
MSRTYAYQIINGTKMPSKDKVIALAIALKCDLHETNNLLNLSNNGNLYSKVKRDALIIKSLNNKYSVEKTNILLDEYNLEILK